jgi:hypothetical protein
MPDNSGPLVGGLQVLVVGRFRLYMRSDMLRPTIDDRGEADPRLDRSDEQ